MAAADSAPRAAAGGEEPRDLINSIEVLTPTISSHPQVATFARAPAPKRKFCAADAYDDIVIEPQLCVMGGRLKEFVAIPVRTFDGQQFARVTCRESWVCQVTAGRVITTELRTAITKAKLHIKQLATAKQQQDATRGCGERSQAGRCSH